MVPASVQSESNAILRDKRGFKTRNFWICQTWSVLSCRGVFRGRRAIGQSPTPLDFLGRCFHWKWTIEWAGIPRKSRVSWRSMIYFWKTALGSLFSCPQKNWCSWEKFELAPSPKKILDTPLLSWNMWENVVLKGYLPHYGGIDKRISCVYVSSLWREGRGIPWRSVAGFAETCSSSNSQSFDYLHPDWVLVDCSFELHVTSDERSLWKITSLFRRYFTLLAIEAWHLQRQLCWYVNLSIKFCVRVTIARATLLCVQQARMHTSASHFVHPSGHSPGRQSVSQSVSPFVRSANQAFVSLMRCKFYKSPTDLSDLVDGGFDLYQQSQPLMRFRDRWFVGVEAVA